MKTEIGEKENYFSTIRINFILLILFILINNLDYFSTYISLIDGGIEINPIVIYLLKYPLILFIWKILILPTIVWYFTYESDSKKVMWSLVGIDLIYLLVVWSNLRVVL